MKVNVSPTSIALMRLALVGCLVVASLAASKPAHADNFRAGAPLIRVLTDASLPVSPLRLAAVSTEQPAPPLPRADRMARLSSLKFDQSLVVLGVAGIAATLGAVVGGVQYAVAAGGATVIVYLLLP